MSRVHNGEQSAQNFEFLHVKKRNWTLFLHDTKMYKTWQTMNAIEFMETNIGKKIP